MLQQVAKF